jgi:arginase
VILHFPQWQGIGFPTNVTEGSNRLRDMITSPASIHSVPVMPVRPITNDDGIFGRADIECHIRSALDILDTHTPKRILTLGGDCGIAVAPYTYLNTLYDGDLQVFWIDAHADINTPDSSFSGHFHGMPLGFLLGEAKGDPISNLMRKSITPDQIAYLALRSIDPPEEEYITTHNIKNLAFDALAAMPIKYKNAIIHLDSDSMDASIYNECSTPTTGGATLPMLMDTLDFLFKNYNVIGATLTEYAPGKADVAQPLIRDILIKGLKANDGGWA